jgi:predicted nucleic acid-binding protein
MTYFDTSIIVAYYAPERISEKAERRLRRAKTIVICPLVDAELASAIARKVRDKELSTADGRKIIAKYNSHVHGGVYKVNPLERKHFSIAAELIGQFATPLRTLDSLHAAVAFDLSAPLVTADKQLFRTCKSLGLTAEIVD